MNVTIIGTGYVGLPTAACLGFLGHNVICLDNDERKIAALKQGEIPIHEPHLRELMELAGPNLSFTTKYAEAIPQADVVFIAVGTPPQEDGAPYLGYLEAAARSVGENLGDGFTVIVNKSTVPIGSGNWVGTLVGESRAQGREDAEFAIASNPEFLREGSALFDTLYPNRIVAGANNPKAIDVLNNLYRKILDQSFQAPAFLPRPENLGAVPLVSTDVASAELIKYAANAFLALKISYINEISRLAEKVGANITQVARGFGLDSRIGMGFLQSGIGWGGSCFGKDTAALLATAREYSLPMDIVAAARGVNFRQRELIVERLQAVLKILKGQKVALLGLAFKPNTDDLRDAPAIDIANRLIERGCRVTAHDPVACDRMRSEHPDLKIQLCESAQEAVSGADAVVLVTEWNDYRSLPWPELARSMRTPFMLDGRNFYEPQRWREYGFRYVGLAYEPPAVQRETVTA
jgi:UDPglucose 6-dehydrogenase